ncbi:hypothetical protein EBZ38_05225 [bacterium]|nr:hypothetical protein [bacterium]
MTPFSIFSIANLILCLGALGAVGVWQSSNDIFTLSSTYGFYWFMCIVSAIYGIVGIIASFVTPVKKVLSEIDETLLNVIFAGISFVGSVPSKKRKKI